MKSNRPHVAAGDSLPGAGQHLQLRVCQCSQGIQHSLANELNEIIRKLIPAVTQ